MLFPEPAGTNSLTRIGAWAPSNFIACLATMPEADQLQILDGSPAAVDAPRRAEAFYRFLLYQLDKELSKSTPTRPLDTLAGVDFVSINEFISGSDPPSETVTRAMTVDLFYASLIETLDESRHPAFGELLQRSLCRESRLRAWSPGSRSYETIVQRKIATSLPRVLSLSCACAGRKEEEGLQLWRGPSLEGSDHWLPEWVEIEIDESGAVVVSQLFHDGTTGKDEWRSFRGPELPPSVSNIVAGKRSSNSSVGKRRYRLEAVLSQVCDAMDSQAPATGKDGNQTSHHVLHARIQKASRIRCMQLQCQELDDFLSLIEDSNGMALLGGPSAKETLTQRLALAKERIAELEKEAAEDEWILINGYVVSRTFVEDARAFHVKFKQPSLVIFKAVDGSDEVVSPALLEMAVPADVMKSPSLSVHTKSLSSYILNSDTLPGRGDLIAFDAEFVSVQEEESTLTETGSKVTLRETRHAVARISLLDCRAPQYSILVDDHVLPREPVVDYLTRFSGIVAKDLDPKQSPHFLIGPRAAYLKLRFLVERGCIFVGHGLQQDFWTVNLNVPAHQIIDTVEIYHKPAQRYISLRFLTNFVLKRDMQQDHHDSVEDAMAAFELYRAAVKLKEEGEFDKLLDDLYNYGQQNDWKVGVDED